MTENALIKIDPKDYNLSDTQAAQVEAAFRPMLAKMVELETEFNRVVALPITPETCKEARSLRLEYVRIRTKTAEIHKAAKAFYLSGGRFVDGWKNAQLHSSQGKEDRLEAIEKHYENLERERIAKLQEERAAALVPYNTGYIPEDLGKMPVEVWEKYLLGVKSAYEIQKEAERKAEEDRIAREKAEAEERERVRKENEKLRAEAEKREKEMAAEWEARAKKEAAEKKKVEAYKKKVAAQLEKEREEKEAAIRKSRELEAAEKKKAAEEKAAAEKRRAEEARLAAGPDRDKLLAWIAPLSSLADAAPECSTPSGTKMVNEIAYHIRSQYRALVATIEKL